MAKQPPKQGRYARKQASSPDYMDRQERFQVVPKTDTQKIHLAAIEDHDLTIVTGPAGTGKTYCTAGKVAELFSRADRNGLRAYDNIVVARSIIPTGKSMGYLPGDVKEKLTPWVMPMLNVLEKALGKSDYAYKLERDIIQIQPLETIRGRSFERTLLMVDEAQNLDFEEIKAITTRIGEGSKMILMGDAFQSDIKGDSPLMKFASMCHRHSINVPVITYHVDDIVRSDITAQLVKMFYYEHGK